MWVWKQWGIEKKIHLSSYAAIIASQEISEWQQAANHILASLLCTCLCTFFSYLQSFYAPVIQLCECVCVCVSVCALFALTVPLFDFWRKLRCTPTFFVFFKNRKVFKFVWTWLKCVCVRMCVHVCDTQNSPIRFTVLLLWRTKFWQTKLGPFLMFYTNHSQQ